ncbi:MAG: OprD family porin [Chromatiales bacterium]|nr:OprD family porin [Chromatiales bacterium]
MGDDLLKGYSFETNQAGVRADMSHGGIFTLAYTRNAPGADLQSPWSVYPAYTSVQVQSFNRAGEEAFMVRGAYDFSLFDLKDLAAYALWVHGWGAVDPVTQAEVYQQDEYDFDLQWRPKTGGLKGLWLRVRYAHVDQRGAGDASANDFRVIVNYDLSMP